MSELRTKDRTWKAVSRCNAGTDMMTGLIVLRAEWGGNNNNGEQRKENRRLNRIVFGRS